MSNIPQNLRYTREHEWIRAEGNEAVIGITDFAQSELGDIVYVEIETVGDSLDEGAVFGTVEAVKTVSDLFMPISGEVLEVNPKLNDEPELVNRDPYGDGWMIRVRLSDSSQLDKLLTSQQYQELVG
jgi:glycine cleavage system H protein